MQALFCQRSTTCTSARLAYHVHSCQKSRIVGQPFPALLTVFPAADLCHQQYPLIESKQLKQHKHVVVS